MAANTAGFSKLSDLVDAISNFDISARGLIQRHPGKSFESTSKFKIEHAAHGSVTKARCVLS